eukprot:310138-Amphidinium_carterae.1
MAVCWSLSCPPSRFVRGEPMSPMQNERISCSEFRNRTEFARSLVLLLGFFAQILHATADGVLHCRLRSKSHRIQPDDRGVVDCTCISPTLSFRTLSSATTSVSNLRRFHRRSSVGVAGCGRSHGGVPRT